MKQSPQPKSQFRKLSLISLVALGVAAGPISLAQETETGVAEEAVSAEPAVSFTNDPEARGTTPEAQKGYDISARSDRTDTGFGDSKVSARMVLRNAAGQETERELSFSTLEKTDETVGDKSLVIFESPRDVEGTALLSHAKILDPDNQWLFLPALKRVKRISSANKSGAFVGSEFAFEDFTVTELNKFTYSYIGEEELDGMTVDVIERFPRYEKSGYTKQKSWVDQDIFQARKVEFYDRRGALLKTLTLSDYKNYNGVWRAQKFSMVNHQSGKETDLLYEDYSFKNGLSEKDFNQGVLSRLR
ncbi:MAG: outer membrane lipoprotein-sorting protein [Pseudomonadota bacterium]